jgi:O-antigen/teichoic acid export membrane protein
LKEKILKGGAALILRQAVSLPINAIGVIFASRFLLPSDFGIQAVLIPMIAFSFMAIDLGTSQALVQKKQNSPSSLLRSVQLLKSGSAFFLIAILVLLSSWLGRIVDLPASLLLIFPACGFMGWLQSQRAFYAVSLQRRIEWQRLAKVEMAEIIVYNAVLIMAAYHLRSVWCFVIALAFRLAVGTVILIAVGRNPNPNEAARAGALGPLLRYGIPLQSATLLSVVMNSANPVVVGSFLGIRAVGFVNWGTYIVSLPQLPLQPLPTFLFSVLSERGRQEKKDHVIIEDVSYVGGLLMATLSLLIIASLDPLVHYIFGSQWTAAIPAVSILVLTNIIIVPSLIMTAQLNAAGYATSSLVITGMGVLLLWTMIFLSAMFKGGLVGYALGVLGATLTAFAIQTKVTNKKLGTRVRLGASVRFIIYVIFCCGANRLLNIYLTKSSSYVNQIIAILVQPLLFVLLIIILEGPRLKRIYIQHRGKNGLNRG